MIVPRCTFRLRKRARGNQMGFNHFCRRQAFRISKLGLDPLEKGACSSPRCALFRPFESLVGSERFSRSLPSSGPCKACLPGRGLLERQPQAHYLLLVQLQSFLQQKNCSLSSGLSKLARIRLCSAAMARLSTSWQVPAQIWATPFAN